MRRPRQSFFRVEANGVLHVTIGFARTEAGTGFVDRAVRFCPFRGAEPQTRAEIARAR